MADPAANPAWTDLSRAEEVFTRVRPRLFGVAYRMTGTVTEAEDAVQETWLRWQDADRAAVTDPAAFLTTIVTRICLNVLQSARARHETYIGPWLPEPVDTTADPALGAERAAALELATLMLLERLAPPERAAYILREAFDYPYEQIAETVGVSAPNARQLVSRARKRLTTRRVAPVTDADQDRLLRAFVAAARSGDLDALEEILAEDVVSYTDGNGVRNAAQIPVLGRATVAKFVRAFRPRLWPGAALRWITANGRSAVLVLHNDSPAAFLTVAASANGIDHVLWVLAPEKLSRIGATPER
ncbi:RNA polymerase sigma24 factor [Mycobacterium sp. SWH-M5]|nr:RNA polymerase sigma24 factor [Mycobacterium sp. SWH-M5]